MAGRHEAHFHLADGDALTVSDLAPVLVAIAHAHDRQRFGRRPHRAVPAAGVIGVAMGDQRARLWLRRIDPGVGGPHVYPRRMGLDPGT